VLGWDGASASPSSFDFHSHLSVPSQPLSRPCGTRLPFQRPTQSSSMLSRRARLLSAKPNTLAQSRLFRPLRPVLCHIHVPIEAALRSNSSLAIGTGSAGITRTQNSARGKSHEAASEVQASRRIFGASSSTSDSTNIPHASHKFARSATDKEAFYRSWLDHDVPFHRPRPCKGIVALSHSDLEARIPTRLREDPLALFTDSNDRIDVVTAHACLQLHITRLNQQARSREDLRALLEYSQRRQSHGMVPGRTP